MTLLEKAKHFRALIEQTSQTMTDEDALTAIDLFAAWTAGKAYAVDERCRYDGKLYRVVQAHTSQDDWTPDKVPALFAEVSLDEWPQWKQPTGSSDAYNKGDKVTYNNQHYISLIDGNVWSPAAYPAGWEARA